MPLLFIFVLALVQGITEFLPISSSGHVILTWHAFDAAGAQGIIQEESQRAIIDVAVHVGTLLAAVIYFWRDIADMAVGLLRLLVGRWGPGGRLATQVICASIPLFIAGFFGQAYIVENLREPNVIAWTTLGFGIFLWIGDRIGMTLRRLEHLNLSDALLIGLSQTLALIPGTSRSGITMTAARFLGFERREAARFSLLLAIPAIIGAGALSGLDLYRMGNAQLGVDAILAAFLAFVSALIAIAVMVTWLRRATFTPFVVYRILLGGGLLFAIHYMGIEFPTP